MRFFMILVFIIGTDILAAKLERIAVCLERIAAVERMEVAK